MLVTVVVRGISSKTAVGGDIARRARVPHLLHFLSDRHRLVALGAAWDATTERNPGASRYGSCSLSSDAQLLLAWGSTPDGTPVTIPSRSVSNSVYTGFLQLFDVGLALTRLSRKRNAPSFTAVVGWVAVTVPPGHRATAAAMPTSRRTRLGSPRRARANVWKAQRSAASSVIDCDHHALRAKFPDRPTCDQCSARSTHLPASEPWSVSFAAFSAMHRPPQEGQKPRRLQLNGTDLSGATMASRASDVAGRDREAAMLRLSLAPST